MNKLSVISFLNNEGINTDKLKDIKDTDIVASHRTDKGFEVTVQSFDYDMIKLLYSETQADGSYFYTIELS